MESHIIGVDIFHDCLALNQLLCCENENQSKIHLILVSMQPVLRSSQKAASSLITVFFLLLIMWLCKYRHHITQHVSKKSRSNQIIRMLMSSLSMASHIQWMELKQWNRKHSLFRSKFEVHLWAAPVCQNANFHQCLINWEQECLLIVSAIY